MLSRLGHIADRYFITMVFALLGWVNAESWPYLLLFVAFGAAIDIRLVKPRPVVPLDLLSDEERRVVRAGWNSLLFIAIGCCFVAGTMAITTAAIVRKSPETIQWLGPVLYEYASPFVGLLRKHYTDLATHGFLDRANLVAFVYAEFFLLFYVSLAVWMLRFRNSGVMDHPKIQTNKLRKQKLAGVAVLFIFSLAILYSLNVSGWISIDYNDHNLRGRHVNTNLAMYNSFFFSLAFAMLVFGFFAPLLHLVLRMMPHLFARSARTPQGSV